VDDFKFKLFESIKFDIYFLCKKKRIWITFSIKNY